MFDGRLAVACGARVVAADLAGALERFHGWDRIQAVNLTATFKLCQALGPSSHVLIEEGAS